MYGFNSSYNHYPNKPVQKKDQISQLQLIQKTEQHQIVDVIGFILAEYERLEQALSLKAKRAYQKLDNLSKLESPMLLKHKLHMNLQNVQDMMSLYKKQYRSTFSLPNEATIKEWAKERAKTEDQDMHNILKSICNIYSNKPIENFEIKEKLNCSKVEMNEESFDHLAKVIHYSNERSEDIKKQTFKNPDAPLNFRGNEQKFDSDKPPEETKANLHEKKQKPTEISDKNSYSMDVEEEQHPHKVPKNPEGKNPFGNHFEHQRAEQSYSSMDLEGDPHSKNAPHDINGKKSSDQTHK